MDASLISRSFDLISLVEADTRLQGSAAWRYGPCPFCGGGVDRFVMHRTPDGYKWLCRVCGDGKYHDAIDYIMAREHCTFAEAMKRMGGQELSSKPQPVHASQVENIVTAPCETWTTRALEFIDECYRRLWRAEGKPVLDWLHQRGLGDEVLHKHSIGYCQADRFEDMKAWGLDDNGKQKVLLSRGIVLPAVSDKGLPYYVKFRRPVAANSKEKKYIKITGSKPGVFAHWNMRGAWLAVITEGELDCLLLEQEAGDLAAVCTFGSATDSPMSVDRELLRWYAKAAHVLVAFDNDEQGGLGVQAMQKNLPRVKAIHPTEGIKDITDAHLAGVELGGWLVKEIDRLGIVLAMPKM